MAWKSFADKFLAKKKFRKLKKHDLLFDLKYLCLEVR